MAFGATILVGMVVALIVFFVSGRGAHGATPFTQGEAWGRPISIAALCAAAIGYLLQQRRLARK